MSDTSPDPTADPTTDAAVDPAMDATVDEAVDEATRVFAGHRGVLDLTPDGTQITGIYTVTNPDKLSRAR
ncbi:hypothetical protein DQ384_19825 [Sphaerisporangium album]|uniref:Uncharacterized protein n=1 Tax=Sphaerisporangium album TaxID=509200 RepID=A0A367FJJ5_9ACTN|nr:hypothetical protein [Sphaerisporangium album]RCG29815.1 hypothetical protein DQ384_19825 [Sphaerisporangium album]